MAIIINEFEIVPQSAPPPKPAAPPAATDEIQAAATDEVAAELRRLRRRQLRISAY